ncbi:MAG: glycerol-3-phosphate 1-O-acyltransferase PlsY [Crocinitomicaceae bacterium]|nr:glycerol-3-phosphate 1-O-acyltransferase PlsY [Crocinitomicaceae bacterium]
MFYILFSIIASLFGSIPSAVWVGKAWYGLDVREHGSKNAGATNTFRVLGKKPGRIVLLIDVLKGALATLIPVISSHVYLHLDVDALVEVQLLAAIFAVTGHVFPIFAQFRGGKGVATSLGVIIGLEPIAALICLAIFLFVFISSKFVSLGAICASIAFPLVVRFILKEESLLLFGFSVLLSGLVIFAHRKNIGRLLKGEESKMNLFKK